MRKDPKQGGWTLVELMLVVALIGLVVPPMTLLFIKVGQGMGADEMHNQLKKLNEETNLRLHIRLLSNKHMFQNDASGVSYFSKVGLGTGAPATISGTHLAMTQPSTVSSFSPSSGSIPASFGNSLFFAAFDQPATFGTQSYVAPLTVKGASITYGASNGSLPATLLIDVYRFYYYYLTTSTHPLTGVQSYGLVEWKSIQYADFYELSNIGDSTLKSRAISWIANAGNFSGGPITWAWDPAQSNPANAFYNLTTAGGFGVAGATIIAQSNGCNYLTKTPSGILSGGFLYGICGNNSSWKDKPPPTVPIYATASGNYPGGFEVGIMGKGAGVQVLTRYLTVAKGNAPRIVWNDLTTIHNTKDVW
ncbi:MAG TPA: type II secretion system protein [bacterium]|nr:type II secretion system protein [bacterium]